MRSGCNFKAAAILSALCTAGFVVLGAGVAIASIGALHEAVALLAFCAAGIGWLSVIVSAAAHAALNR